jgi:hypothetical protein
MRKRMAFFFPFFLSTMLICGCGASIGDGNHGGGVPTTITFTITGVTPTAVATKIGSGPFTPATLSSGAVTITIPSNETSFAVAYFCTAILGPSGNAPSEITEQDAFEATTLDGNSFSGACLPGQSSSPPATPLGQLTGSIDASAIPGVNYLVVSAPNVDFNFPFTNATSFGFATTTGTDRVLVLAYDDTFSPPAPSGSTTLAAAKNFDSQAVPGALNGGSVVTLGLQDETTPVAITYSNLPSGFTIDSSTASFVTSADGAFIIASPATKQYVALPKRATESGDYYRIYMDAYSGNSDMTVIKNLTSAAPVTLTFPPSWIYAGPTPAAQPTFNAAYQGFSGGNGVSYGAAWNWWPINIGIQYSATVTATANYLNGATSVSMPDLSGLAGALPSPVSGTSVNWTATITQTTYESQPTSLANATVTSVQNSGTYKVP